MTERPVVALMHGHGATKKDLWIPSVERQFLEAGCEVIALRLPNKGEITLEESKLKVKKALGGRRIAVVVAHSAHARTFLHCVETEGDIDIDTYVGVGVFLETIPSENTTPELQPWKPFYSQSLDFKAIKRNTRRRLALYSSDDPWLKQFDPYRQADIFRDELHGSVFRFKNQGHFTSDSLPLNLAEYLKQGINY